MSKPNNRHKGPAIMNSSPAVRKNLKEQKFDFCFERKIQGWKYMEIVRAFVEQFGDSERNAKYVIRRVEDYLENPIQETRVKHLNEATAQYRDLYRIAYDQGKLKECIDIRARMDKLLGLDRIIIEQNVNVNDSFDYSTLPPEMIDELLRIQAIAMGNVIEAESINPTPKAEDVDYEEVEENPADDE